MIERKGDLFTTDAKILGHGVNVRGVMGAGIAKAFKEKYPLNYEGYKLACDTGRLYAGRAYLNAQEPDVLIANFASQDDPGPFAQYDWLFTSLHHGLSIVDHHLNHIQSRYGNVIALPHIGCGIGGLKWGPVSHIIEAVEECFEHRWKFEVWDY